ncbi:MAG: MmcQ/YjbR family DNA-binding protein [Alphaproteobacteria bacterium]|nr:MmcQ/YjbR family DNA-binding protein [Alphaproteobacteria bacterium SS10]
MRPEAFNDFCGSLLATNHVVQWGGADVWKVADKMFAIGFFGTDYRNWPGGKPPKGDDQRPTPDHGFFTFKVSPLSFDILKDQPGLRPAPYLASRGMSWIQHYDDPGLSDDDLKAYLTRSYYLVAAGLSRKKRDGLGITIPDGLDG